MKNHLKPVLKGCCWTINCCSGFNEVVFKFIRLLYNCLSEASLKGVKRLKRRQKNLSRFNKSNNRTKQTYRPLEQHHFTSLTAKTHGDKNSKYSTRSDQKKSHSCRSNECLKEIRSEILTYCEHLSVFPPFIPAGGHKKISSKDCDKTMCDCIQGLVSLSVTFKVNFIWIVKQTKLIVWRKVWELLPGFTVSQ